MSGDKSANISGGNVQAFIQENNGVVNQNFINHYAESYSRQTSGIEQPLTQVEYGQRKVLLSKVKEYWIKGVLEKSLHSKAMIELGLERRSDAVESPFSAFKEVSEVSRQVLPTGTGATEFFNQIGEGRTLLILGEPGAGKTITLLKLAQNLITLAELDLSRLIPVVFNLSSWGSKRQNIADWLVQELWSKYQVPKALGKDWVKNQKLLLLLDGLDEVKADLREACVETINQFVQEHGQTEMVVCSRIADYEILSNRLQLRGAIYIRSLTPEQVNQYLDVAGEPLAAVKTLLTEDTILQELAKSPLTLSIMTLAYQGKKVEELPQTGSLEVRRQHLFNAYIERMFKRKGINQEYSKDQTIQWLTWLAQRMQIASQSVFLIEKIQPNWLQKDSHRLLYSMGVSLTVGLSAAIFHVGPLSSVFKGSKGLVEGLMGGLIAGLLYGLLGGVIIRSLSGRVARLANGLTLGLLFGLVFWLVLGQKFGLTYGFFYALCGVIIYQFFSKDIEPADTLEWSWEKAMKSFGFALIFVLILSVTNGPIFGLIFGFLLWLILSWEKQTEIDRTTRPNQGIWKSVRTTIKISTMIGLFSGIVLWLIQTRYILLPEAKVNSLVFGIANGIMFGYGAALLSSQGAGFVGFKHLILRLLLWRSGCIPWNYARFLDYANERIFLRKVGGGYIFVHRVLLEHFATRIHPTKSEIRNTYKTLKIIFVGVVIIVFSIVGYSVYLNAEYQLNTQANIIISTMDSVRKYNNDRITPLLKTQSEQKFLKESIPDFATNQVFHTFTSVYKDNYGDYLYRSAMINPTNPKDKATPGEVKIIETLKQQDLGNQNQLGGQNIDQGYVNIDRKNYFYISRPIKITDKTCLICHSTLEKAPQSLQVFYKNGTYVAPQGLGWEFNTVIGAKVVYIPTTQVHKIAQRVFIILLGVCIAIFAVVIIERAIAKI